MFPKIAYILFDLDGTLYSARWGLEQAVSGRVNDFLASYLNLPKEEAWAFRKERITAHGYGTTLEWLRAEHGLGGAELEQYLAHIHPENEADALPPDPAIRPFLQSFSSKGIPTGRLTNSPLEHAERILKKLDIADLFPVIFDIRRNGFRGKPDAVMYREVLKELNVPAPSCLLVDDIAFYVEGYLAIGGTGVYLDEDNRNPAFPGLRITKLEELTDLCWPDGTALF
jgi:putative hydrolase of the HAD superfamily